MLHAVVEFYHFTMSRNTKVRRDEFKNEPTPPTSSESDEEEYTVEKVLDRRYIL